MTGDLIDRFRREGVTPVKLDSKDFLLKIAERI